MEYIWSAEWRSEVCVWEKTLKQEKNEMCKPLKLTAVIVNVTPIHMVPMSGNISV